MLSRLSRLLTGTSSQTGPAPEEDGSVTMQRLGSNQSLALSPPPSPTRELPVGPPPALSSRRRPSLDNPSPLRGGLGTLPRSDVRAWITGQQLPATPVRSNRELLENPRAHIASRPKTLEEVRTAYVQELLFVPHPKMKEAVRKYKRLLDLAEQFLAKPRKNGDRLLKIFNAEKTAICDLTVDHNLELEEGFTSLMESLDAVSGLLEGQITLQRDRQAEHAARISFATSLGFENSQMI